MKKCNKCKSLKGFSDFNKRKSSKDGLTPFCAACNRQYCKERRQNIKNKQKQIPKFKTCSFCRENKSSSLFYKKSSSLDGLNYYCKECCYKEEQIRRNNNTIKNKYKNSFKDKTCHSCGLFKGSNDFYKSYSKTSGLSIYCKECVIKWRNNRIFIKVNNKKCIKCMGLKKAHNFYVNSNTKDGFSPICIECDKKRQIEYAPRRRKKRRERYKNDIVFRLKSNIQGVIYSLIKKRNIPSIKGNKFKNIVLSNLSYTIEELKSHIESLWEPWMSWDNYGRYYKNKKTWQIDHIVPQSAFPYDSMEHPNFQKCWALNNLRPLEAIRNLKKSNKLIDLSA